MQENVMDKEGIIRIMDSIGVAKQFVKNWEGLHKRSFDDIGDIYVNLDPKGFALGFNWLDISFIWNSTPEGPHFWQSVYYSLIYRYVEEEVRLVKQAVLLLRKEGYVLVEDSLPYMHRDYGNLGLSVENEKVAYCVSRIGDSDRLRPKISDIEYIRKAKKMLTDVGIYKFHRFMRGNTSPGKRL